MIKNQYIEERRQIEEANQIAFYYDKIPFSMCIPQYQKSLAVFNQFIQENPKALDASHVRAHLYSTIQKGTRENVCCHSFHHYVIESNGEKWGINILLDSDKARNIEMDQYVKSDDMTLQLRTMFFIPKDKKDIELLDCSFFVLSATNEKIVFDISRPDVLPNINQQDVDNSPLIGELKQYYKSAF